MKRRPRTVHRSPERRYRTESLTRSGEVAFQAAVGQSDLWIVARERLRDPAMEALHRFRGQLTSYLTLHPEFGASLSPVTPLSGAPQLIRGMAEAGRICGVGPMASVAGTIAQAVAEDLARLSPDVLVENGGDIYMISTRERTVALLADPASGSRLGLRIDPHAFPLAVCSSSALIGHSLSLGQGELVTVLGKNGALADAAATALCNMLRRAEDVDRVLETAQGWAGNGVCGVFAQGGGKVAAWGDVELVTL